MINYFFNFKWKKFLYNSLIEENNKIYIFNSQFKFHNFTFFLNDEKFFGNNF